MQATKRSATKVNIELIVTARIGVGRTDHPKVYFSLGTAVPIIKDRRQSGNARFSVRDAKEGGCACKR
jgi:hypothetical protein